MGCLAYVAQTWNSMAIATVLSTIQAIQPGIQPFEKQELVQSIALAACEHQQDPAILFAIAEIESTFRHIPGPEGLSFGVMQVNYKAWKGQMPDKIWRDRSIKGNVRAAAWILHYWSHECHRLNTCSTYWNHYFRGYSVEGPGARHWNSRFQPALNRWRLVTRTW